MATWVRGPEDTVITRSKNRQVMYDSAHDRYIMRRMIRGGINDWGAWRPVKRDHLGVIAHQAFYGPGEPATEVFRTRNGLWTKGQEINHVVWHHTDDSEPGSTPERMRLGPKGAVEFLRDGHWMTEGQDYPGPCEAKEAITHFWTPYAVACEMLRHVCFGDQSEIDEAEAEFVGRCGLAVQQALDIFAKAVQYVGGRSSDHVGDDHEVPSDKGRTAASFLNAALGHMQDRAVTYDRPQGERSMGNCVAMFNIATGHNLTEEQGWIFQAILKIVRSQQGKFRADSYEDLAAYAGLAGETAARDRA